MHTHVHERWDARVELEFGHPMRAHERDVAERLERVKKRLPHLTQLAVTACLEHFTAGQARLLLSSAPGRDTLRKSREPYRSLWTWHAIEELEHKAVALDVYKHMGGGYLRRCAVMLFVAPAFVVRTIKTWWMLVRRRRLPVLASVWKMIKFLFWWPGYITRFASHFAQWFSPWYNPVRSHPRDAALVAKYAALLRGKEVEEGQGSGEERGAGRVLVLGPDGPRTEAAETMPAAKL